MKYLYTFLLVSLFLSCENSEVVDTSETDTLVVKKTETLPPEKKENMSLQNCTPNGKILPGNRKNIPSKGQEICILATAETTDEKMGDSHRSIQVIDRKDCSVIYETTLEVNRSPDFPYYFADINYNNTKPIIAIKGFNTIHCYDINQSTMLSALRPTFTNPREAQDAQSGRINTLELWENYMIGHAQDYGTFVFDLNRIDSIQAVLPFCEYVIPGLDQYASLFQLTSTDHKSQFLFPDYSNQQFSLNPLFEAPISIDPLKTILSKDKKYVLLWQKEAYPIAIDMLKKQIIQLSQDLLSAKPKTIFAWLEAKD